MAEEFSVREEVNSEEANYSEEAIAEESNVEVHAANAHGEDIVSTSWQHFFQATLGVFLVAGALFMSHYYQPPPTNDLQQRVQQLTQQVKQLQQEETMPAVVLDRYRNSSC
jgi:hypothetical protein